MTRASIVTRQDAEACIAMDGHPRRVHIMVERAGTGAEHLAMGTQEIDPGSRIPLHVHEDAEEILFIYGGHGRVQVGAEEFETGPETAVFVPKGTLHGVVNLSGEPLLLTWTFSPPGAEERFRREDAWMHVPRSGEPRGVTSARRWTSSRTPPRPSSRVPPSGPSSTTSSRGTSAGLRLCKEGTGSPRRPSDLATLHADPPEVGVAPKIDAPSAPTRGADRPWVGCDP